MKNDRVYRLHIQECIAKIETYCSGGRQAFMDETIIQDAVMRNLEVSGEAARNVSIELRRAYPSVGWRGAMGLRNVLIHNYMGVNVGRVWSAVIGRLPELKREVAAVLASLPPEDTE